MILTFDRDYGELIYRHKALPPAGVVYLRFAPITPSEPGEILLNIIEKKTPLFTDRFTIIERGRIRQRPLHAVED